LDLGATALEEDQDVPTQRDLVQYLPCHVAQADERPPKLDWLRRRVHLHRAGQQDHARPLRSSATGRPTSFPSPASSRLSTSSPSGGRITTAGAAPAAPVSTAGTRSMARDLSRTTASRDDGSSGLEPSSRFDHSLSRHVE